MEKKNLTEEEKKRKFFLEIKRDLDLGIAHPIKNETSVPDVSQTSQLDKIEDKEADLLQINRSFPQAIQRHFYIRSDHRGDQHVYADSQGKQEIFQETGDKLCTKNSDTHAVKIMLDTAAHRGWTSITIKGTKEFRRETWLEGQARGIVVSGYKPTELDLQELKNRERGYLRNEITPHNKMGIKPDQEETFNKQTQENKKQPTYHDGIEGILIEQGQRPYKDNPKKDASPYIVMQDTKGNKKTIWGVGLPNALLKAGANKGDHINIREAGMETVTKNILREINGRTVRVPYQVQRRAWEAEVIQERNTNQEREQQLNHLRPLQDKKPQENTVYREVSRSVASAERTLHVGHGRDVALEDGIYANEARAKAYMAAGRVAAGRMPELKNAAAIEAYIERKVKQKYPNDPVLLQRIMQTARNKIGHAVARGYDFPQPRVVDKEEFEKARQIKEQDKHQNTVIKNEPTQQRAQNREHDRAQNRSR